MASNENEADEGTNIDTGVLSGSASQTEDSGEDGWEKQAEKHGGEETVQTADTEATESAEASADETETPETITESVEDISTETEPAESTETATEDSDEDSTGGGSDSRTSVRDMETMSVRVPEKEKERIVNRWMRFEFEYHKEHGVEIHKNRTFHPALMKAAFSERTLDEILTELVEEGVDEIPFPAHAEN